MTASTAQVFPAAEVRTGALQGRQISISGIAQGVGFRPFVYRLACAELLSGRVYNDAAGVAIEAFGSAAALERFIRRLVTEAPALARIEGIAVSPIAFQHRAGFAITSSPRGMRQRLSIPADLATCPACVAEIFNPHDRRFGYPFTNCTNCGPRFTIVRELPYDRAGTTMAAFAMCVECRHEYEDSADRRFHAQANACRACGPRLWLTDAQGTTIEDGDPIARAAAALRAGEIVAVKGLGGFHLACDATSRLAVAMLRRRKRRDEKPFAVMVADLDEAEPLAVLSQAERDLLRSAQRPIVLVHGASRGPLAPEVAPGSPMVGLMLAYTPLHHLLLRAAGRPLVMTSGNLSDEPIVWRNEDALARLAPVADLLLLHDRDIAAPCEDSVARIIDDAPIVMRRSRGYVPRPVTVARSFKEPVLAVGGQLKNAFCLGLEDAVWFGPHLGDLDSLESCEAFQEAIARMERMLGVRPQVVAHDLHPDYQSTRYALARPATRTIAVQHHHAHVISAMAEHRLEGPVLGVAFDGSGLGTDGAIWGGELLLADPRGFERIATLRPIALAGGDRAIREVWRLALALLDDALGVSFDLGQLALFRDLGGKEIAVVRRMMANRLNTVPAHGAGRYFDALGAVLSGRPRAAFEGQVALMLDNLAATNEAGSYDFQLDRGSAPWQLDLRPMVRQIVAELLAGGRPAQIAARFHNTLVAGTAAMVRAALASFGRLPVVLSGGCFQNARLAEGIIAKLGGLNVYLSREVPPGDGGLALGQAIIAGALTAENQFVR